MAVFIKNRQNRQIITTLCLACLLALFLCSCNRVDGAIEYEIVYPSGNIRNGYWYDPVPVEGTSCLLACRKEKIKEGTYARHLQILDETGSLLYEYEGLGNDALWGESAGDGTAWITSENWQTMYANGYCSHNLLGSVLLSVDLSNGDILFRQETGAYELYLTTKGTSCYFYDCGEEGEEMLFGLLTAGQENARIFYRDVENWDETVTVYTFDYAVYPDIEGINGLRFSLEQEDEITITPVDWTEEGLMPIKGQGYAVPLE